LVASFVLFGLAAFAPLAVSDAPDQRAGIEHARAAGIIVDPAAEDAMMRAPVGSCANDPTRTGCPPAKAYVQVELDVNGGYIVPGGAPASSSDAAAMAASATRATAAADVLPCFFRGSAVYKSAGYAQGDAAQDCWDPNTQRSELYGTLYKYYSGNWYQMVTRSAAKNGTGSISVHPRWDCVPNSPRRSWNFTANGYAEIGGTWYASPTHSSSEAFYCG